MEGYAMHAYTEVKRRLVWETHVGRVIIVTSRTENSWETEVMGGQLDGWAVLSKSVGEAEQLHLNAVELVRSCN
jgi:hypothetical protein